MAKEKEWNTIKSILKHSFQYKHVLLRKWMLQTGQKAIANGYRTVVAVGGDGTLHDNKRDYGAEQCANK